MSKPVPQNGDIAVSIAHSAPVLVRARRGDAVTIARTPLVTPASIRRIPPNAFTVRRVRAGEGAAEDIPVFENRLWRRALPDLSMAEIAAVLARPDPTYKRRLDLDDLGLDPLVHEPRDGRLTGPFPEMAEEEVPRIVMDLSGTARAAMVERFTRNVVSDGEGLWIAIPTPMVCQGRHGSVNERADDLKAAIKDQEYYSKNLRRQVPLNPYWQRPLPRAVPSAIDDYVRYHASLPRFTAEHRAGIKARAAELNRTLAGLDLDPHADLARFVRLQSLQLLEVAGVVQRYKADHGRISGVPLEELKARVAVVLPIAALSTVHAVEPHDIPRCIDAMHSLALHLREHRPRTGSYVIGTLDEAIAYIEQVARPRMAQFPVIEADAESLGNLVP